MEQPLTSHRKIKKFPIKYCISALGVHAQMLAGGIVGVASVRRGWCCPVPDTADSIQLQWTHSRVQMSLSAKMVVTL